MISEYHINWNELKKQAKIRDGHKIFDICLSFFYPLFT